MPHLGCVVRASAVVLVPLQCGTLPRPPIWRRGWVRWRQASRYRHRASHRGRLHIANCASTGTLCETPSAYAFHLVFSEPRFVTCLGFPAESARSESTTGIFCVGGRIGGHQPSFLDGCFGDRKDVTMSLGRSRQAAQVRAIQDPAADKADRKPQVPAYWPRREQGLVGRGCRMRSSTTSVSSTYLTSIRVCTAAERRLAMEFRERP